MNNFRGHGGDQRTGINLNPLQARILSVTALCGMSAWFLSGILVPRNDPYFVRLFFQLLGSVSALVLFLSSYGFVAFTTRREIGQRELHQRNIATSHAYYGVLVLLGLGFCIGKEIARVPPETFADFMAWAVGSCLIMPATLLAWRDDGR